METHFWSIKSVSNGASHSFDRTSIKSL